MRDIRTVNCKEGQKIESDKMLKRIGDIAYRNLGTISRAGLFDSGQALIVGDGLRVEPSSGMTVNVPSGTVFQRFIDVIPCIQISNQTVTMDAASGIARKDIVEAQIKIVSDKTDWAQVATVASGTGVSITNEEIKRDIKYYLSARKQTDTTTPTAATAGTLTGTAAIPGTVDLSEKYLLNLSDGEDGSFQEIDCRGATPEATTRAEIMVNINAATGRTAATAGSGNVIVLTGIGTGQTSYFTIKPPVTDSDKDCLEEIFGISAGGVYQYIYEGDNEWFKLAEIDIGTATTTITSALIRNIDKKNTWTGNIVDTLVHDHIYQPNVEEWNKYSSATTYSQWDAVWVDGDQYISLKGSNLNKYPITEPNYWEIVPDFKEITKQYQKAVPIQAGLKDIDNYRDGDYEQWAFSGYFQKDSKTFSAYKVHLDGTVLTGDADLEDIFDPGGGNEYFALDILAPDVVGTRTLPDLRGRVLAAVDDVGGNREAVGTIQEDQFQAWQAGCDEDGTGARDYWGISGSRNVLRNTGVSANNIAPYYNTGGQGNSTMVKAMNDGTNGDPRQGKETQMKNYSIGIPYIVVLLET